MKIAADVETFSELTWPSIGSRAATSAACSHSITDTRRARRRRRWRSGRSDRRRAELAIGLGSRDDDVEPGAREPVEDLAVGAAATGTAKTVALLARMTLGLPQSATGDAAITASTPTASAVRSIAPRLPGFSIASHTSTNGLAPSAMSLERPGGVGDDGKPAVGGVSVRRLANRRLGQRDDARPAPARPARRASSRQRITSQGREADLAGLMPASSARPARHAPRRP